MSGENINILDKLGVRAERALSDKPLDLNDSDGNNGSTEAEFREQQLADVAYVNSLRDRRVPKQLTKWDDYPIKSGSLIVMGGKFKQEGAVVYRFDVDTPEDDAGTHRAYVGIVGIFDKGKLLPASNQAIKAFELPRLEGIMRHVIDFKNSTHKNEGEFDYPIPPEITVTAEGVIRAIRTDANVDGPGSLAIKPSNSSTDYEAVIIPANYASRGYADRGDRFKPTILRNGTGEKSNKPISAKGVEPAPSLTVGKGLIPLQPRIAEKVSPSNVLADATRDKVGIPPVTGAPEMSVPVPSRMASTVRAEGPVEAVGPDTSRMTIDQLVDYAAKQVKQLGGTVLHFTPKQVGELTNLAIKDMLKGIPNSPVKDLGELVVKIDSDKITIKGSKNIKAEGAEVEVTFGCEFNNDRAGNLNLSALTIEGKGTNFKGKLGQAIINTRIAEVKKQSESRLSDPGKILTDELGKLFKQSVYEPEIGMFLIDGESLVVGLSSRYRPKTAAAESPAKPIESTFPVHPVAEAVPEAKLPAEEVDLPPVKASVDKVIDVGSNVDAARQDIPGESSERTSPSKSDFPESPDPVGSADAFVGGKGSLDGFMPAAPEDTTTPHVEEAAVDGATTNQAQEVSPPVAETSTPFISPTEETPIPEADKKVDSVTRADWKSAQRDMVRVLNLTVTNDASTGELVGSVGKLIESYVSLGDDTTRGDKDLFKELAGSAKEEIVLPTEEPPANTTPEAMTTWFKALTELNYQSKRWNASGRDRESLGLVISTMGPVIDTFALLSQEDRTKYKEITDTVIVAIGQELDKLAQAD